MDPIGVRVDIDVVGIVGCVAYAGFESDAHDAVFRALKGFPRHLPFDDAVVGEDERHTQKVERRP